MFNRIVTVQFGYVSNAYYAISKSSTRSIMYFRAMNQLKNSTSHLPSSTIAIWRQYEKLLKEAVNNNHYYGLKELLNNEHVVPNIGEFKERCCKPLIMAIANKNVCLINLMCKHGYKLPDPHPRTCKCDNCNGNR